jgi:F0F1-type ATP synthase assembly protein I
MMHSEYEKPLLGDLVVEFSNPDQVPEYPYWLIVAVAIGLTLSTLIIARNKRLHAKF